MITLGGATRVLIRWVASIPSTPGIRTSISTTSGRVPGDYVQRRPAVGRLADHLDVLDLVEDHPESGAHEGLVVDEHDSDHGEVARGTASKGSVARTRKPPAGSGPGQFTALWDLVA
jgi:hypothetical protein